MVVDPSLVGYIGGNILGSAIGNAIRGLLDNQFSKKSVNTGREVAMIERTVNVFVKACKGLNGKPSLEFYNNGGFKLECKFDK